MPGRTATVGALVLGSAASAAGAVQDVAAAKPADAPPVSLAKIRDGISRTPALNAERRLAVPTFRTTTEARALMVPFEEHLRQDLEPSLLQRQSRSEEHTSELQSPC